MIKKVWAFIEGWKTRIASFLVTLYGGLELVDPTLLSTALGLDQQDRALLIVGIGVTMFILRQVTRTPAPPVLPRRK